MKKRLLIVFMVVSNIVFGQTNEKSVVLNQNENYVKVVSATANGLTLEVAVNRFNKEAVSINGKAYHLTSLASESFLLEKGSPQLPKIARSFEIPANSGVTAKVVNSEFKDIDLTIAPSKGSISRTVNPDDVAYSFSSIYSANEFFPKNRVELGEPYLIRNTRGNALTIYPFAYNPVSKKLRIYTKMVIEVSFMGSNMKNASASTAVKSNNVFDPFLNNHFINHATQRKLKSSKVVAETGRMLVIAHDAFMDEMQPLVDDKNSNGIPTTIVGVSTIGNNANSIFDYIKSNYDNDNSLTYVLLVGDKDQVATKTVAGGGSDPSYSLLSGDDNYPDVIVGRFSAETAAQVETMVKRSLEYAGIDKSAWVKNAIGIASKEGPGDDNEYDHVHMRNIRTQLLDNQFENVAEFYEGSQGGNDASGNPTASMVKTAINNGVSLINYVGHGSETQWVTSGFSMSDVNALTNEQKLPFIFSVACVNGDFTNRTCFAESWIRATSSNTNNPTGAMLIYASSINQDWKPPMEAQDNLNDMITSKAYSVFGALCYNASCKMMDAYGNTSGSSGANMFLTWNIFGDPSQKLEFDSVIVIPVAVTGVSLSDTVLSSNVGKIKNLSTTIYPSNATNTSVNWSTSNNDIATVSQEGLVTFIAEGVVNIIVTTEDGGFTDTCKVTVEASLDDGGLLTPGVVANGELDNIDKSDLWFIDVPENTTSMRVVLECGRSDFDTYGKFGEAPGTSTNSYDWRGYTYGGEDNTIYNPKAGRHFILVNWYEGTEKAYTLKVTFGNGRRTSSLEELSKVEDMKVYPNPVRDFVNIELSNSKLSTAAIYDMSGKKLIESTKQNINVSTLSKGVYVLKVATEEGVRIQQIIKE